MLVVQRLILATSIGLLVAGEALAGGASVPFGLDSAGVMPKGVRSVRLNGFSTEVTESFDGSGSANALGNGFNKPVTWNDLGKALPEGFERDQFMAYVRSKGNDVNSVLGDTSGQVNTRLTATIPILAYGLTEKLTLAIVTPIIYSNTNVSTGWTANEYFNKTLASFNDQHAKLLKYEKMLDNVIKTKSNGAAYKPLQGEKNTDLADVTVAAKYQTYKDERVAVAIQPRVVLPTGRKADPDKLVDLPTGDGQFDVGVSAVADVVAAKNLSVTGSVGYLSQLPTNQAARRIPQAPRETLSPDVDHAVRMDLGDIATAAVGPKYKLTELWTLGAAYNFQYKAPDYYNGSQFDGKRYEWLSIETEQAMHSAQLGVSFSTVPLFLSKKFAVPLETGLTYSSVFAGRNVTKLNIVNFELAMFF